MESFLNLKRKNFCFRMSEEQAVGRILNFNLGVLGHVDSGKTSLARVLSGQATHFSGDFIRSARLAAVDAPNSQPPILTNILYHIPLL